MPKMKKCCLCINLKLGVLIISVIELYSAAVVIFATIATLCDPQKIYNYPRNAIVSAYAEQTELLLKQNTQDTPQTTTEQV
ncbi:11146_t:CDS:2 [Diversispora eburnea]|uniref:11146_t:CDS:1 n=1 Tax=Diversispora eburnea TaxID=1213867 RepID=A0A9N8VCW3_9GLOM|nr:11146_t:CDS:2 [Diversispora eburnea]